MSFNNGCGAGTQQILDEESSWAQKRLNLDGGVGARVFYSGFTALL